MQPPRPTPTPTPTPLPPHRNLRLALAGALAGMFTNTLLHPLDTIKTLRQTQPHIYQGVTPAFRTIIQSRGPLALYAGLPPALVGSALSSALYFGVYELVKSYLKASLPSAWNSLQSRIPLTAISASCGNLASSVLFVPKEVVKQRMQAGLHRGRFFAAAAAVIRTSGFAGLYRGYQATLLRNIPSTMIRFAMYEEIKLLLKQLGCRDAATNRLHFVVAGALSGAIASACTTPFDVVKTRLATGGIAEGTGVWRAMLAVVRREGVAGLYVGTRPRVIWAALFAAIGFSSYEVCKAWMLGFKGRGGDTVLQGKTEGGVAVSKPNGMVRIGGRGTRVTVCARRRRHCALPFRLA